MPQSTERSRPCRAVVKVGDERVSCEWDAPHAGIAHTGTVIIYGGQTRVDWVSDGEARRHGKAVAQ